MHNFIASGEDIDTDDVNCIIIEADDYDEALSIYKRCFTNDTCINIDILWSLRGCDNMGYPEPTHQHVVLGAHHHAVGVTK